jgi:hypothetical protein
VSVRRPWFVVLLSVAAWPAALVTATAGCDAFEVERPIDAAPGPAPTARIAPEGIAPGDGFGASVSRSGDRLAIGAPGFDRIGGETIEDAGAVFVFRRVGVEWVEESTLTAPDPRPGDRFGAAVTLERELLAVGAPGDGAVYTFRWNGTAWEPR